MFVIVIAISTSFSELLFINNTPFQSFYEKLHRYYHFQQGVYELRFKLTF